VFVGYTDYMRRVYDPVTKTNMNVLSVYEWTPDKEQAYSDILRMIGLERGWRSRAYTELAIRDLRVLVIQRRRDSWPFMRKYFRRTKR